MDLNSISSMMAKVLKEYKEQESSRGYSIGKPYLPHVDMVPFPLKFVQPHLNMFNETTCPWQHLAQFESRCGSIIQHSDLLLRLLVQSLDEAAFTWYSNLKLCLISNWESMKRAFLQQFWSAHRTIKVHELTNERQ